MGVVVLTWEGERELRRRAAALVDAVAREFDVEASAVWGNSQRPAVNHARYVAAFLLNLVALLPEDLIAPVLERTPKTIAAYADRGNKLLEQDGEARARALAAWAAYKAERRREAPTAQAAGGRIRTGRRFLRWARAALRAAS